MQPEAQGSGLHNRTQPVDKAERAGDCQSWKSPEVASALRARKLWCPASRHEGLKVVQFGCTGGATLDMGLKSSRSTSSIRFST